MIPKSLAHHPVRSHPEVFWPVEQEPKFHCAVQDPFLSPFLVYYNYTKVLNPTDLSLALFPSHQATNMPTLEITVTVSQLLCHEENANINFLFISSCILKLWGFS